MSNDENVSIKGLIEDFIKSVNYKIAIECSKGENRKNDQNKAEKTAAEAGHASFDDTMCPDTSVEAQANFCGEPTLASSIKSPVISTSESPDSNDSDIIADFAEQETKKPLTKEHYITNKKKIISDIVRTVLTALIFMLIPCVVLYKIAVVYNKANTFGVQALILVGGILTIIAKIIITAGKRIMKSKKQLSQFKEDYISAFSDEDKKRRENKLRITGIAIASVIAVFFSLIVIVGAVRNKAISDKYEQAVELYDSGSYSEAKELFESIEHNCKKDTTSYIKLCKAQINYAKGYLSTAYYDIDSLHFSFMTEEQQVSLDAFTNQLTAEYKDCIKKQAEYEIKAYRDRITNGVPYVGMSESEIKNTSLGYPSFTVRHNSEWIDGKWCSCNIYDFKKDNYLIFSARCAKGKVINVWDYRDKPVAPYTPKKSSSSTKADDPYNAKDYYDAEDFYYDNYDDFYDYYDAEDYFEEHN